MGNSSRPGSLVVREIDHPPFQVDSAQYCIRELVWNGDAGRSFDVIRLSDQAVLTDDDSFDAHPTDAQVATVLDDHGVDVELDRCAFCGNDILAATAHRHANGWVGDTCCWDERLRSTE